MWSSTLQINWKQRFFVPTDEEPGIAVLASVLEQFPVIATEDEEADCYAPFVLAMPSVSTVQPIDLETWIIETAGTHHIDGVEQQLVAKVESESEPTSDESEPMCAQPSQSHRLTTAPQAAAGAMLVLPPDYRSPTIQIGFNFPESESI